MSAAGLSRQEHIVFHGFTTNKNGDQIWCFMDHATDYCVYRRGITNEQGEFDLHDEKDFDNFDKARAYANELSTEHGNLEIFTDL